MGRYDALTQLDTKSLKPIAPSDKPANPQEGLPASPQTRLPANPQEGKTAKPLAVIPANPLTRKPLEEVVEKYTTRLKPSIIKQIKHFALEQDIKDYEVVQQAVQEFLAKKK
jgi:hypothetical protein